MRVGDVAAVVGSSQVSNAAVTAKRIHLTVPSAPACYMVRFVFRYIVALHTSTIRNGMSE